ncbi:MAG: exodeoxyribonuclease VII large subunit [Erysipelothrix sp.]|nr:exodeoxyribonuclease VII large subunit [Erysipelothrix sp.]
MKKQQWSVKALVAYLKMKLDNDSLVQNISVIGELSNFNHHHTNHMYFTLKDDKSRISCVMFASSASKVNFVPENGMQVVINASVSIFEASGSLQLYVKEMIPFGTGNLALKFEQLKDQLKKEGIFNDEYKKSLPTYPMNIAVVSGKDSAALSDIMTTLKRRWPIANVSIFNTLVQGPSAHLDIIDNLRQADQENFDIIILARGGGSIEDLWPFNEELLAREIFKLNTPIISGVGHEVDFTIADFVSDLRAPTPTAAAEIATPDIKEVISTFNNIQIKLINNIENIINTNQMLVDTYKRGALFTHPDIIFKNFKLNLDLIKNDLNRWKDQKLRMIKQFAMISNSFKTKTSQTINNERLKLNNLNNNLVNNMTNYNNEIKNNFLKQIQLIDSFSPINTLKRGYSIVEKNDKILNSITSLVKDDKIKVVMHDGSINAIVIEKRFNDE